MRNVTRRNRARQIVTEPTHITHQSWLSTGFVVQGVLRNTIQLIFRENRLVGLNNVSYVTQHWLEIQNWFVCMVSSIFY